MAEPILTVEHLIKAYGETPVLDDISFAVKPGEVIEWNYTCDLGCDLPNGDPYGYGKEWKENHD